MNVVLLRGTLSSEPTVRELPSGSVLVNYEVTTRDGDGPARSVPVAWFDPRPTVSLEQGTEVVVVGQVRRRYFRSGGSTASRTEVVATAVIPARQRKKAERLVAQAVAAVHAVA